MTLAAGEKRPARLANLLLGADGKLRFIWRAVIFWGLANYALPLLGDALLARLAALLHLRQELSATSVALGETELFLIALICTALFARYERRRVDSYGLPLGQALGRLTGEGFLVGIVMSGAAAVAMCLLGGMQVRGLALGGWALVASGLGWLVANIIVGVAEEFMYRAYFLHTLWRSMGFWPASLVIALIFTADHYFYKAGENVWDVITLMSLSMLVCYTVLRSGSLWFAVGFHIAFDFMQLFVIGTPNGEQTPVGRLLDVSFDGPAWLTGGVLGTEASFLMYPLIALGFLYVGWRFRGNTALSP